MTSAVLVGVMSGTSLDGVSAAVARFTEDTSGIRADLLAFVTLPYDDQQRARLAAALIGATPAEYARLDFALGEWLSNAAVAAMAEAGVPRAEIAAVASHGHTVWHDPPNATWQFGQAAVMAERTGLDVISDFRVRDVAAGGQGAPLVPMADALLFSAPSHWRALQNIGGIGNITVVPPAATVAGDLNSVRAFDTGPGVCVIDGVVRTLYPTLRYDDDGALAASGSPVVAVVTTCLEDPYFAAAPPKSTGRELFTAGYITRFIESCRAAAPACSNEDIVATAVLLTARSVALAFRRFIPEPVTELVVSGGGARNGALVGAISRELSTINAVGGGGAPRVVRFDELFFDGDAKEAVAFALLGWLHLQRRAGNVPTATGARGPRVLGALTPGRI